MKRISSHFSRYHSHNGWALVNKQGHILTWTFSTTERELNELLAEQGDMVDLQMYRPKKVMVNLAVVADSNAD